MSNNLIFTTIAGIAVAMLLSIFIARFDKMRLTAVKAGFSYIFIFFIAGVAMLFWSLSFIPK